MTDLEQSLHDIFGFDGFRPGQRSVTEKLLAGRSVLAIFPTGGGKSLCYQLPAMHLDGVTLVVSPLIALMKDQVDFLQRRGVAAARLDSSLDLNEVRKVMDELRSGKLKLLYVAPERLASERFRQTLKSLRLPLMAIDEAHCISEWGHNFRPDYLELAQMARDFGVERVLALTATATPEVAQDIARSFSMAQEDIVQTGFYRPNLDLSIVPCAAEERPRILLQRLGSRPAGPAIVYVTLQRTAEEVADALVAAGLDARAYHAGLAGELRHSIQDWFMASDRGIVVATIAFGMGIDKANIRAIYHFNLPKGLESYAQEIGRAGRDGKPASCDLLACASDVTVLENFSYGDTPTAEALGGLLGAVLGRGPSVDLSVYQVSQQHDLRPLVVETALTYLELDGLIRSTGAFYDEYQFQTTRPREEILGKFDPRRRSFLAGLFESATKARTWSRIDLTAASSQLGETRERLLAALNYLEEQGDLILRASGVRQAYRVLRQPDDLAELRQSLEARFLERERRDIARIQRVLAYASRQGCYTRHLLAYFGEERADCGHCSWCRGERPGPLPPAPVPRPGAEARAWVDELRRRRHAALATPRQIARFLCGITSPASTRAKLTRDRLFGALAGVPFARVLELGQ